MIHSAEVRGPHASFDTVVHMMHGCNNRFFVIDDKDNSWLRQHHERRNLVRDLATQSDVTGFVVDSILTVSRAPKGFHMRVFDRDGSEERMCGNGIRCVAKYLLDLEGGRSIDIHTGDGVKRASYQEGGVSVSMGFFDDPVQVSSHFFVDTGNPHLVVVNPPHLPSHDGALLALAQSLSGDPALCSRVGVPVDAGLYVNFVWTQGEFPAILTYERFIGRFTDACGTGNCAVGLVLSRYFGVALPVSLVNRGGEIVISEDAGGLCMTGPAVYIGARRLAHAPILVEEAAQLS